MKRSSLAAHSPAAFTLIELLTVIAIISILMAMLFPMVTTIRENAKKSKAKQDCLAIVHSVESYNGEYGQYPKIDPSASSATSDSPDDACGDMAAGMTNRNASLFNTLRDIDRAPNTEHSQNPKHQVFHSGNAVGNPAKPKEGYLEVGGSATGTQGSFYDPWGQEYNIVIDSNSDNLLKLDPYYGDFSHENNPRAAVGAFSLGKDKKLGKGDGKYKDGADKSDDLVSWAN